MSRHPRTRTAMIAVGALVLMLTAAACSPLPPPSTPTSAPTAAAPTPTDTPSTTATQRPSPSAPTSQKPKPTPKPTQTQTQTPTPKPTDESADWVISNAGIGPIKFGASFAGIINADGTRWVDNSGYCANVAELAGTQDDYYISVQHTKDAITSMQVRTSRSDPASVGPRTADGLGVGSTREDILAAVPTAKLESPKHLPGTEFVSVPGPITMQFVFFDDATKAGTVILSAATTLRESICD